MPLDTGIWAAGPLCRVRRSSLTRPHRKSLAGRMPPRLVAAKPSSWLRNGGPQSRGRSAFLTAAQAGILLVAGQLHALLATWMRFTGHASVQVWQEVLLLANDAGIQGPTARPLARRKVGEDRRAPRPEGGGGGECATLVRDRDSGPLSGGNG